MADISVEFHATQEELQSFANAVVREFELHVAALQYPPFAAMSVKPTALDSALINHEVSRLAFTLSPPVLGAAVLGQFLDQNPGVLMLDIGRLSDAGLRESWLTARTTDPDMLQTWKKIAARLKKMTFAGAIAINPKTGATSTRRSHRCTSGAKQLQARGVTMLPYAGSAILRYVD